MDINQIMKELIDTLDFANKHHQFLTITLEAVAIHEAKICLEKLFKKYRNNLSMTKAIADKIYSFLQEAKEKGIIFDYCLSPEGIRILPLNMKSYEMYPAKSHYILIKIEDNSNIA